MVLPRLSAPLAAPLAATQRSLSRAILLAAFSHPLSIPGFLYASWGACVGARLRGKAC